MVLAEEYGMYLFALRLYEKAYNEVRLPVKTYPGDTITIEIGKQGGHLSNVVNAFT